MSSARIGWIGLGAMGAPMARNLVMAGREVLAWNRSAGPVAALAAAGGTVASDPVEVASCPVVVSALADDTAVRSVLAAPEFLAAATPGSVHVNCATISAELADDLAARYADHGLHYLAAPVFGRVDVAAAGALTAIVAGSAEAVDRGREVLDVLTARVIEVGSRAGVANLIKICGNYLIASTIAGLGEITALAEGAGVDPALVTGTLTDTLFGGLVHRNYGRMIGERDLGAVSFTMTLGLKDVDLARREARRVGIELPVGDLVSALLTDEIARGHGDRDWAALSERFRPGTPS